MARTKARKEVSQERMRAVAQAIADMEAGTFDYPNGQSPCFKNGRPRVDKSVALRTAGYAESYIQEAYRNVFNHPYYNEQLRLIKASRNQSIVRVLEKAETSTKALSRISEGLLTILADRIERVQAGEEEIGTKDLLKYALPYFRTAAEIEGKLEHGKTDKLAIVLAAVDARLPKESRDRLTEKLTEFRLMRDAQTDEYMQTGDALDSNPIIDVEADEC